MEPEKGQLITIRGSIMEPEKRHLQVLSASLFIVIAFFCLVLTYYSILTSSWILFIFLYIGGLILLYVLAQLLPLFSRREKLQNQMISMLSLLLGIGVTYITFMTNYGDKTLIYILKGISIQNLLNLIFGEMNPTELLTELFSWIYFIILFIVLYFVDKVLLKKFLVQHLSEGQQLRVSNTISSFREGSLILPVVIMIGFPLLLQLILPTLIIFVAFFELILPFIIVGEIFYLSVHGLKNLHKSLDMGVYKNGVIQHKRRSKTLHDEKNGFNFLLGIISSFILILVFPLFVYYIIETGFIKFLNLVHYNLLWDNPDSQIAELFWNIIDTLISILSLNIEFLNDLFHYSKYFLVPLIILVLSSILYLSIKQNIRRVVVYLIDRFILPYQ